MVAELTGWGSPELGESDDADLLDEVRRGDTEAFAELWRRHLPTAYAVAHQHRGRASAEDIVAEAATRVLSLIQQGKGPTDNFRAYFMTTVRTCAVDSVRGELRVVSTSDEEMEELTESGHGPDASEILDKTLVAQAFRELTERERRVLWQTTVHGQAPRMAATELGMTANAVSVSAMRARENLRTRFLAAHAGRKVYCANETECHYTQSHLASYVRDSAAARTRRRVQTHLDECDRSRAVLAELETVNASFEGLIVPIVFLGGLLAPGAGHMIATLGAGGAVATAAATTGASKAAGSSGAGSTAVTLAGGFMSSAASALVPVCATAAVLGSAVSVGALRSNAADVAPQTVAAPAAVVPSPSGSAAPASAPSTAPTSPAAAPGPAAGVNGPVIAVRRVHSPLAVPVPQAGRGGPVVVRGARAAAPGSTAPGSTAAARGPQAGRGVGPTAASTAGRVSTAPAATSAAPSSGPTSVPASAPATPVTSAPSTAPTTSGPATTPTGLPVPTTEVLVTAPATDVTDPPSVPVRTSFEPSADPGDDNQGYQPDLIDTPPQVVLVPDDGTGAVVVVK